MQYFLLKQNTNSTLVRATPIGMVRTDNPPSVIAPINTPLCN